MKDRWQTPTVALAAILGAVTVIHSFARDGQWGTAAGIVALGLGWELLKACLARSRLADPQDPIWPSKDPADYR